MKKILFFFVCVVIQSCTTNCHTKGQYGRYELATLFTLVKPEIEKLHKAKLDTAFFIDSFQVDLNHYRAKLKSILQNEDLLMNFDRGFLIENFFVYKKGIRKSIKKDSPYDYRAVVYFEAEKCKTFLNIDIGRNTMAYNVDRIRVNTHRDTTIQKWLSSPSEIGSQYFKGAYIDSMEEQYDVVTKLTENETFTRVLIDYSWTGFSANPLDSLECRSRKEMGQVGYLMFLTGHGFSF